MGYVLLFLKNVPTETNKESFFFADFIVYS